MTLVNCLLVDTFCLSSKNKRLTTRLFYIFLAICLLVSVAIGATVGLLIGLKNNDSSSNKLLYENIQVKNAMDTLLVCGFGVVHYDMIPVTVAAKYSQSI